MSSESARRYCTFYLGEERYGIDILVVREINRRTALTRVPRAPDCVRGLLNLRGQIVTVLDPALRLGEGEHEFGRATRLVILKTNAELAQIGCEEYQTGEDLVGLCVDRIADVVTMEADELSPAPSGARGEDLISSVGRHEGEMIRILDGPAMARVGEG